MIKGKQYYDTIMEQQRRRLKWVDYHTMMAEWYQKLYHITGFKLARRMNLLHAKKSSDLLYLAINQNLNVIKELLEYLEKKKEGA